jgi:wobble nucleotide-excising tRNase
MDQKMKEFCRKIKESIYTIRSRASNDIADIQEDCHHPFIRETVNTAPPSRRVVCRVCDKELTASSLMKQWEELLGDS